jgi:AcrR family transcriptional regulator
VEDVKTDRSYSSPLRTQQASATRRAVLEAARELFIGQGYGATTVDQIAARAGVSKPTVFTSVGNKQTVLAEVRDVAMAGDDEPIAVQERPLPQQIVAEPDQRRAVELLAQHIAALCGRYALIDDVLRGAASSGEPGLRELWDTSEAQRLTGARIWADTLSAKGRLRDRVSRDAAVDVLWLYMAPDVYYRLVHGRGWTPKRYEAWLAETLRRELLPAS